MSRSRYTGIRILNLVTSLGVGGIERYLLRVIEHSDRERWHHEVLCKSGTAGELVGDYKRLGVPVHLLRQGYFNPWSWFQLYQFICRNRYDAVVDFTDDFAGIPLVAAKAAGVRKRIAWYRSSSIQYAHGIRDIYAKLVRSLVKRTATDILSNSIANLDSFHPNRSQDDPRFAVIENGIPIEVYAPDAGRRITVRDSLKIPAETIVVGHVGGFRYAKNHEVLIRAAEIACEQHSNLLFMLVGDGDLRPQIEQEIVRRKLDEKFMLLGNRTDVPDLLQAMDIFVFPSRYEGSPNALIEAMLVGLPFVASAVPAILETIPEACSVWTVSPDDHVALANRIIDQAVKPDRRLADVARSQSQARFAMDQAVSRYLRRLEPPETGLDKIAR